MSPGSDPAPNDPGSLFERVRPSYRTLDVTSKLAGLALVAGALEVGPTALGIGLAATGAALATITVFIDHD